MGESYGYIYTPVPEGSNMIMMAEPKLQETLVGLMRWRKLFKTCFISLLYLDLYVLGDDALIS